MTLPRILLVAALAAPLGAPSPVVAQSLPRLSLADDTADLDAALSAKTPPRDLGLRVAGIALPDADPAKARLLIVAEIDAASSSGSLASVAYVVENGRGQPQGRALRRRELPRSGDGRLGFSEVVTLPAGSYRVKVAAMVNGRVGGAQAAVTVAPPAAGPLRLGDLVVGESAGLDLGGSLAFDRRIRGDRLVASVAVASGAGPAPDVTLSAEIAKDAGATALISAPAVLLPADDAVRVAQAVLDVRVLPAGDYQARVVVSAGGRELGRVSAPFARERGVAAAPAASARPRGPAAAPPPANGFRTDDVMDPAVLVPFLDELALRASDRAKSAIDQAKAGRFAEALKAAPMGEPNDAVRPFLTGLSLYSQKQLQAASEAFRDTLRAAPDYFAGAFYIGACYAAGGRDPQAVNAWQTSLVGLDTYPIVFRMLGDAWLRMGQPDRAIDTLDEALAKWPADVGIRLRLSRASLEAKRYGRVLELVDAAPKASADLLLVAMQSVWEQVTVKGDAATDDLVQRVRRYRDAYAAAGGAQQALADEWVAAVEKRK